MARTPDVSAVVMSTICTHVLPTEGLELPAGVATSIPAQHLSRVLDLPGVVLITPTPATPIPEED